MSCVQSITYAEGPYRQHSHWHPTDQLLLILDGTAQLQVSAQTYSISCPSVVFISHLESHEFLYTSDNYRRFVIDIIPSEASQDLSEWDRLLAPFMNRPAYGSHVFAVVNCSSVLETLFQMLLDEFSYTDQNNGQSTILQTILHYLFRKIPKAFPYHPDSISGIVRQLQRHFDDMPQDEIRLEALADEYHLSVSHLAHSFKKITGYSIGQYRLLCRIAHAKTLLTKTDFPISEVCMCCGFSDASNFSRHFRKEVGMTPSEFRKIYGNLSNMTYKKDCKEN